MTHLLYPDSLEQHSRDTLTPPKLFHILSLFCLVLTKIVVQNIFAKRVEIKLGKKKKKVNVKIQTSIKDSEMMRVYFHGGKQRNYGWPNFYSAYQHVF